MDFRAAYLPDKYWHRRSILVPKRKVILDERFKTVNDIFHNETERQNFEIYWVEYGVYGNVRLIGELNYCYLDGKYYHLEKVRSQGFVQNGQLIENVWDYYLEYDDWMNDWLNDRVDITGTINKTGNINQVNQNIVQIAPLIQGQNTYQTFNGIVSTNGTKRIINFNNETLRYEKTWLNPNLWRLFNNKVSDISKKISNPEVQPNPSRLVIPLLLTRGRYLEWYYVVIRKLVEFLKGDLQVYDLKKVGSSIEFNQFKSKYGLKEIFVISSPHYNTYEIAQSVNQHIKIKNNIDLSGLEDITFLDNRLIPDYEKTEFKGFLNLMEPYLLKYGELTIDGQTKTIDFNYFVSVLTIFNKYYGDICWNEKLFDKPRFLTDQRLGKLYSNVEVIRHDPDKMIWEHPETGVLSNDIWWSSYLNNFVFTQRLITRNFIYEPGTSKLYIAFLRKIGKNKLLSGTKYSIGKDDKYPPKTPAFWFNTNRIDELTEWLSWLNNNPDYLDPTFNSYSDNPLKLKNPSLLGNLVLLDNSAFKFIDSKGEDFSIHEGAFLLLPDYREKVYVLAEGVYFDGVQNLNVIDYENRKEDIDENHTYTLLKEIGSLEQKQESDWKKPRTDEILNNENRYYEKYFTLLPLTIKWTIQEYKSSYTKNKQRFKYMFYPLYIKYYEGKTLRTSTIFQFPLIGCGFDVYELVKSYANDLHNGILQWGFLADEETKKRNNWEDRKRDGKNMDFYLTPFGEIKNLSDVEAKDSEIFDAVRNELIEIRLNVVPAYSDEPEVFNKMSELLTKLWVYYFCFRWDGSYNGANYINANHNGTIKYTKPFNHRYYSCIVTIRNYPGDDLNSGESKPVIKKDTVKYYNTEWNIYSYFYVIGWDKIYGGSFENITDEHWNPRYLLLANAQSIEIAQSPTSWETFGLFQTDHIKPDKFAYLLKAEKPWEYIKFNLPNPPPENPFKSITPTIKFKKIIENKLFKTNRILNPDKFNLFSHNAPIDVTNEEWRLSLKTFDEWTNLRVPLFIFKYLNPNLPESRFHTIDPSKWNDEKGNVVGQKKFDEFEKRFEHELQYSRSLIEQYSFLIDLVGTDYVAVCRISVNGEYLFELVSKTNKCYEKNEILEQSFIVTNREVNNFENTVKRINSNYELSVYGQRFPLKTRPELTGDNIDVGLRVIPINDPKQSETSLWYMLTIQTQQDVQRIRIEVPKELTAMHNQSPYEREDILRKIAYHSYERQMESSQFNLDKEKYRADVDIKGRRMDISRNREITSESIGMAQTALSTAQAVAYGASGWNPAGWGAAAAAGAAGAAALVGQGANMAFSKQLYDLNREEHAMVSSHGMRSLENRGLLIAAKHQDAQASERLAILNMQHNVSYPANSDALMYREENKQFGLTDIHLIRYYPEGDQLRFLVNYYKEYGFNVIVPNVRCLGASWIHDHIQYVKITSNAYENETIKRMIEERALNGITMVDNDDWHADRIKPNDDLGDLNEDAKQLYTNQEN